MVQSGACKQGIKKPHPFPNNKDSINTESFKGSCMLKVGDIFVNRGMAVVSPFVPKTWPERVEIKTNIGNFSDKGAKSFMQINSNLEIPGYNNPVLNGKGYTFNQLPNER